MQLTTNGQEQYSAQGPPRISISTLPTELIAQIAAYLDLPTFQALRLTSTRFHTGTIYAFKARFFTAQHLSWTQTSFQRLLDISTPSDLGTALQHLIIDASPHHALTLWKLRRRSADAGHMTPITDDEDGSVLAQRLHDDYAVSRQKAQAAATWLNETRFDVRSLSAIFSRVSMLESITFAYEGMAPRYSKFAARYCEASQHEMSRPFISTLSALAASGTKVRHIKMQDGMAFGAVSIGRLESLAPALTCFGAVFERLETLQLNLRDWRLPDSGFEVERTRAPFVVRFLAKCRSVKVLELSCYSALEEDLLGVLARTCRFERLERCTLGFFRLCGASDLVDFLSPSSSSLRELRLQHFLNAAPSATWADVLSSLSSTTSCLSNLDSLSLNHLFTQHDAGSSRYVAFVSQTPAAISLLLQGEHWRTELDYHADHYEERDAARIWEAGAMMYPFTRMFSG